MATLRGRLGSFYVFFLPPATSCPTLPWRWICTGSRGTLGCRWKDERRRQGGERRSTGARGLAEEVECWAEIDGSTGHCRGGGGMLGGDRREHGALQRRRDAGRRLTDGGYGRKEEEGGRRGDGDGREPPNRRAPRGPAGIFHLLPAVVRAPRRLVQYGPPAPVAALFRNLRRIPVFVFRVATLRRRCGDPTGALGDPTGALVFFFFYFFLNSPACPHLPAFVGGMQVGQ